METMAKKQPKAAKVVHPGSRPRWSSSCAGQSSTNSRFTGIINLSVKPGQPHCGVAPPGESVADLATGQYHLGRAPVGASKRGWAARECVQNRIGIFHVHALDGRARSHDVRCGIWLHHAQVAC